MFKLRLYIGVFIMRKLIKVAFFTACFVVWPAQRTYDGLQSLKEPVLPEGALTVPSFNMPLIGPALNNSALTTVSGAVVVFH